MSLDSYQKAIDSYYRRGDTATGINKIFLELWNKNIFYEEYLDEVDSYLDSRENDFYSYYYRYLIFVSSNKKDRYSVRKMEEILSVLILSAETDEQDDLLFLVQCYNDHKFDELCNEYEGLWNVEEDDNLKYNKLYANSLRFLHRRDDLEKYCLDRIGGYCFDDNILFHLFNINQEKKKLDVCRLIALSVIDSGYVINAPFSMRCLIKMRILNFNFKGMVGDFRIIFQKYGHIREKINKLYS